MAIENVDVLGPNGVTQKALDKVHLDGDLHRNVHIILLDPETRRIILQRRYPGGQRIIHIKDFAGGHIRAGESYEGAAVDRLNEHFEFPIAAERFIPIAREGFFRAAFRVGALHENLEDTLYVVTLTPAEVKKLQEKNVELAVYWQRDDQRKEGMVDSKVYELTMSEHKAYTIVSEEEKNRYREKARDYFDVLEYEPYHLEGILAEYRADPTQFSAIFSAYFGDGQNTRLIAEYIRALTSDNYATLLNLYLAKVAHESGADFEHLSDFQKASLQNRAEEQLIAALIEESRDKEESIAQIILGDYEMTPEGVYTGPRTLPIPDTFPTFDEIIQQIKNMSSASRVQAIGGGGGFVGPLKDTLFRQGTVYSARKRIGQLSAQSPGTDSGGGSGAMARVVRPVLGPIYGVGDREQILNIMLASKHPSFATLFELRIDQNVHARRGSFLDVIKTELLRTAQDKDAEGNLNPDTNLLRTSSDLMPLSFITNLLNVARIVDEDFINLKDREGHLVMPEFYARAVLGNSVRNLYELAIGFKTRTWNWDNEHNIEKERQFAVLSYVLLVMLGLPPTSRDILSTSVSTIQPATLIARYRDPVDWEKNRNLRGIGEDVGNPRVALSQGVIDNLRLQDPSTGSPSNFMIDSGVVAIGNDGKPDLGRTPSASLLTMIHLKSKRVLVAGAGSTTSSILSQFHPEVIDHILRRRNGLPYRDWTDLNGDGVISENDSPPLTTIFIMNHVHMSETPVAVMTDGSVNRNMGIILAYERHFSKALMVSEDLIREIASKQGRFYEKRLDPVSGEQTYFEAGTNLYFVRFRDIFDHILANENFVTDIDRALQRDIMNGSNPYGDPPGTTYYGGSPIPMKSADGSDVYVSARPRDVKRPLRYVKHGDSRLNPADLEDRGFSADIRAQHRTGDGEDIYVNPYLHYALQRGMEVFTQRPDGSVDAHQAYTLSYMLAQEYQQTPRSEMGKFGGAAYVDHQTRTHLLSRGFNPNHIHTGDYVRIVEKFSKVAGGKTEYFPGLSSERIGPVVEQLIRSGLDIKGENDEATRRISPRILRGRMSPGLPPHSAARLAAVAGEGPVVADYTNVVADGETPLTPEHGIIPDELEALAPRLIHLHAEIQGRKTSGGVPALHRPDVREEDSQKMEALALAWRNKVDDVVVLGGMESGAQMGFEALVHAKWNGFTVKQRDGYPRIHFMAPDKVAPFLKNARDNRRVRIIIIGDEAGNDSFVSGALKDIEEVYSGNSNFVVLVTHANSALDQLPASSKFHIADGLSIHDSFFSPAGLFPLVLAGKSDEARRLVAGGQEAERNIGHFQAAAPAEGTSHPLILEHGEYVLPATISLLTGKAKDDRKDIFNFYVFSEKLRGLGRWRAQRLNRTVFSRGRGEVVDGFVGSRYNHFVAQNLQKGANHFYTIAYRVGRFSRDIQSGPTAYPTYANYSLAQMHGATADGTTKALVRGERPNATISVPQVDAFNLGKLIYSAFYEDVVLQKLLSESTEKEEPSSTVSPCSVKEVRDASGLKLSYTEEGNSVGEVQSDLRRIMWEVAVERASERTTNGGHRFLSLPEEMIRRIRSEDFRSTVSAVRDNNTTFVVIGIGGSSQGAKMQLETLGIDASNIIFLEGIDPDYTSEQLDGIDWTRTGVLVISKSGETMESNVQFSVARQRMEEAFRRAGLSWNKSQHIVAITDEAGYGFLAEEAHRPENGYGVLKVPSFVDGRFTVLSDVGLAVLSLKLQEKQVLELLEGAKDYVDATELRTERMSRFIELNGIKEEKKTPEQIQEQAELKAAIDREIEEKLNKAVGYQYGGWKAHYNIARGKAIWTDVALSGDLSEMLVEENQLENESLGKPVVDNEGRPILYYRRGIIGPTELAMNRVSLQNNPRQAVTLWGLQYPDRSQQNRLQEEQGVLLSQSLAARGTPVFQFTIPQNLRGLGALIVAKQQAVLAHSKSGLFGKSMSPYGQPGVSAYKRATVEEILKRRNMSTEGIPPDLEPVTRLLAEVKASLRREVLEDRDFATPMDREEAAAKVIEGLIRQHAQETKVGSLWMSGERKPRTIHSDGDRCLVVVPLDNSRIIDINNGTTASLFALFDGRGYAAENLIASYMILWGPTTVMLVRVNMAGRPRLLDYEWSERTEQFVPRQHEDFDTHMIQAKFGGGETAIAERQKHWPPYMVKWYREKRNQFDKVRISESGADAYEILLSGGIAAEPLTDAEAFIWASLFEAADAKSLIMTRQGPQSAFTLKLLPDTDSLNPEVRRWAFFGNEGIVYGNQGRDEKGLKDYMNEAGTDGTQMPVFTPQSWQSNPLPDDDKKTLGRVLDEIGEDPEASGIVLNVTNTVLEDILPILKQSGTTAEHQGTTNLTGDEQLPADDLTNQVIRDRLLNPYQDPGISAKLIGAAKKGQKVHSDDVPKAVISGWGGEEEPNGMWPGNRSAKFGVMGDSLDGSSRYFPNGDVATIIAVHRTERAAHEPPVGVISAGEDEIFARDLKGRTGRDALYSSFIFLYGVQTLLFYASKKTDGVMVFRMNPDTKTFRRIGIIRQIKGLGEDIRMAAGGKRLQIRPEGVNTVITQMQDEGGAFDAYNGAYWADVVGVLLGKDPRMKDGGYVYVADPKRPGRIRFAYEEAPGAFILEAAGGSSIAGEIETLDVRYRKMHQQTPVIVGTKGFVDKFRPAYHQAARLAVAENGPKFWKIGELEQAITNLEDINRNKLTTFYVTYSRARLRWFKLEIVRTTKTFILGDNVKDIQDLSKKLAGLSPVGSDFEIYYNPKCEVSSVNIVIHPPRAARLSLPAGQAGADSSVAGPAAATGRISPEEIEKVRTVVVEKKGSGLSGVLLSRGQSGRGLHFLMITESDPSRLNASEIYQALRPTVQDGSDLRLALDAKGARDFEMAARSFLIPLYGQPGFEGARGIDPHRPVYPDWVVVGGTPEEDARLTDIIQRKVGALNQVARLAEVRFLNAAQVSKAFDEFVEANPGVLKVPVRFSALGQPERTVFLPLSQVETMIGNEGIRVSQPHVGGDLSFQFTLDAANDIEEKDGLLRRLRSYIDSLTLGRSTVETNRPLHDHAQGFINTLTREPFDIDAIREAREFLRKNETTAGARLALEASLEGPRLRASLAAPEFTDSARGARLSASPSPYGSASQNDRLGISSEPFTASERDELRQTAARLAPNFRGARRVIIPLLLATKVAALSFIPDAHADEVQIGQFNPATAVVRPIARFPIGESVSRLSASAVSRSEADFEAIHLLNARNGFRNEVIRSLKEFAGSIEGQTGVMAFDERLLASPDLSATVQTLDEFAKTAGVSGQLEVKFYVTSESSLASAKQTIDSLRILAPGIEFSAVLVNENDIRSQGLTSILEKSLSRAVAHLAVSFPERFEGVVGYKDGVRYIRVPDAKSGESYSSAMLLAILGMRQDSSIQNIPSSLKDYVSVLPMTTADGGTVYVFIMRPMPLTSLSLKTTQTSRQAVRQAA
ncbi:MAG: NUDIX domain-containing protein [Candidatus Omnitrophica bacterium]|nr:NUDIX domain-containing protein [Candidatus Omnitrophota bacterium]